MEIEHFSLIGVIGLQLILFALYVNYQERKSNLLEAKFKFLLDRLKMHRIEIDRLNLNEAKRALEKEKSKA